MESNQSEVEKFLNDLPEADKKDDDIFSEKKEVVPAKEEPEEDEKEVRKNRRHRRLEEQLRQEREANIELAARLKVLSEQSKEKSDSTDLPSEWIALYGDSPEAKKAWALQQKLLEQHTDRVREEVANELKAEREQALEVQQKEDARVASELEQLEDTHGIDLTSNSPAAIKARNEFLTLVEKLSPKDEEGGIIEYADFDTVFETYQSMKSQNRSSRSKEIASRSMQESAPNAESTKKPTPGFFGWRNDLGI